MRYIKTNFHTHSIWCDGKSTLEENVLSAIEKGIEILGFSSHSSYPFWVESCMHPENFHKYREEILSLKKANAEKIDIRLGFEADFIPGITFPKIQDYKEFQPDFLIGSVHFLWHENGTFAVDASPDELSENIKKFYGGDVKAFVNDYFNAEKKMLETGNFQIIGHADLIRKFNDRLNLFDESETWYKNELKLMAEAISKAGVVAEINTGAISRGWKQVPYPSDYFLSLMHEKNIPVMINSDSHHKDHLDCAFELALQCAKKAGYSQIAYDVNQHEIKFCDI